ncbi:hypothetical protein [Nocardia amamiensis]|uniref:hypothetical protein n=1 Tax=Nocardia amamiensis TaxID=404578 RepID=UPI00340572C4
MILSPPVWRRMEAARLGAALPIRATKRKLSGATSTSARLFSMARTAARATSWGERVPMPRGSVAPESANMPAPLM